MSVAGQKLVAPWGGEASAHHILSLLVENRPGGDGLVAINAFTSANDDHTLLFVPASTFTAHPYLHDKLPYDMRDIVPVAGASNIVVALAVLAVMLRKKGGGDALRRLSIYRPTDFRAAPTHRA